MVDATPYLRLYAQRRRAALVRQDAAVAQAHQLRRLVRLARHTRFGRDHDFGGIEDVPSFQARVPLRRYDDFWREYWQPAFPNLVDVTWPGRVPFFALSSGTSSGTTKYIPCTAAMNRANTRAGLDLLSHHLAHRPSSRAFGAKMLMLGGSTALTEEAPGVFSGDLSGIAVARLPWWARRFAFPPLEVALLTDWEDKVGRIAALAAHGDIRVITGTPSWLLILFREQARLLGRADATAAELYPNLDLLVHGGVNFAPYRAGFEAFLAGSHAELREVYPASEGFIALQDETPADGLRLMVDNGLFFEFIPVDQLHRAEPDRRWLGTAQLGTNYAIIVSSCAGLWSYVMGDTVRLVSLDPPRLLITGRTSYTLSAFGEHLIGEEIEAAVASAAAMLGLAVTDYSVGAVLSDDDPGGRGGHVFVMEFDGTVSAEVAQHCARLLDADLARRNDDYRTHRAGDYGMAPPRVVAVSPGGFAQWMKRRGKLGGQNKVPRIINDDGLFADLRRFVGDLR